MALSPLDDTPSAAPAAPGQGNEVLRSLIAIASCAANTQLDAFVMRLADALFNLSEASGDPKTANLSFNAANLLRNNGYAFYYLASIRVEEVLRQAVQKTEFPAAAAAAKSTDDALTLVSYEEMDKKVRLSRLSRPIEAANGERLDMLNGQLASLLGRDELTLLQNPFRPEVFISALNDTWAEFDPESETQPLVLPLLTPEVFLDLSLIYQELIDAMTARGISPDGPAYRLRKSEEAQAAAKEAETERKAASGAVSDQLKNLFASKPPVPQAAPAGTELPQQPQNGAGNSFQGQVLQMAAVSNQLLAHLASMQKNLFEQLAVGGAGAGQAQNSTAVLSNIKQQAPQGALSQVDETKIDLLTKIFDVVFRDQNIPTEIKALIGFLQVPVLKAALIDQEFFFQDEHPARKLIELLTKSSLGWDRKKGQDDPLYQTIKRNVERVQQDFDQQISVFSDVVSDLESFIKEEETVAAQALTAPITKALKQEKIGQATKVAKHEVKLRIGTGGVVGFVEGFLERKWVPVLTLAYSIKDEKPEAVEHAVKTMDDLIWSVKPKITMAERRELIAKLPSMLTSLNQWLNLLKWEDAERLQFFAELAECHASIVRAPLELSPQRQLEIAMDVAKQAAERRMQKRATQEPDPVPDDTDLMVQKLERGTWMEFDMTDGAKARVRLAWISPLRTLYIFSTIDRKESFSMSAENLAKTFREQRVRMVSTDQLVGRALAEALESVGANDPEMNGKSAA
ncbi:DUF1631 family protein [Noviherbaspirillum sp.]|uniref:DUF1631 family protein n=1 Tax=Noviherbaspirillum sp. TaxID=1926288 RepID=UPI002FDF3574